MDRHSSFEVERRRGVLKLSGELDIGTTPDLLAAARLALAADGEVMLDLSDLEFMDSSGLQALLEISARMGGRILTVKAPEGQPRRLFALVALHKHPRIRLTY